MDVFNSAQGVLIQSATFNNIQGNQINTAHNRVVQQTERKHTIYDEYHHLISGDVYRLRGIHREDYSTYFVRLGNVWKQGIIRAERTICHAEVQGRRGFTEVSYRGQDAKKIWEKDFRRYTEAVDTGKIQLFGINRSSVPFLIFYGELVPVAHIYDGIQSQLSRAYLFALAVNLRCLESELWVDPKQGTLICGPPGPKANFKLFFSKFGVETLLSNVEFLQDDDGLWRYLSHLPLNREFDEAVIDAFSRDAHASFILDIDHHDDQPIVISSLTNSIIAVGIPFWEAMNSWPCSLHCRVVMPNRMTRFQLKEWADSPLCRDIFLMSNKRNHQWEWLSQAPSVFHQLGISLDKDLSHIKLSKPEIMLQGFLDDSKIKVRRRQIFSPIYLFILPPPFSIPLHPGSMASHHFWSCDATGQTRISEHDFGLPSQFHKRNMRIPQSWWPTKVYKNVHRWQVDRGFDPKTTNFARYIGYPVFEVQEPESSRFEEYDEGM